MNIIKVFSFFIAFTFAVDSSSYLVAKLFPVFKNSHHNYILMPSENYFNLVYTQIWCFTYTIYFSSVAISSLNFKCLLYTYLHCWLSKIISQFIDEENVMK